MGIYIKTLPQGFDIDILKLRGYKIACEMTDPRLVVMQSDDIKSIKLHSTIAIGETCVSGHKRLERLQRYGYMRLGIDAFKTLWECRHELPPEWKTDKDGNPIFISCDGEIIRSKDHGHYVPCMYFLKDEWYQGLYMLESVGCSNHVSAVIENASVEQSLLKRMFKKLKEIFGA